MDYFKDNQLVDLLVELVKVPSISGTQKEQVMGERILEILATIPYFKENPNHLYSIPIPSDPKGRFSIAALLAGRGKETVILLNHLDVVDILDYGADSELAFDPYGLTQIFHERSLPLEVKRDLLSGDYLFGRGVADMKGGMAVQINLLHEWSQGDLPGNILFLSTCDEETSSQGILSSLPFLLQLKEEKGLHYCGVVNCEPTFPAYPGDQHNYIYTGSMGKALVMFCFYGQETHAGDSLGGLNANLMASQITCLLEGNVDFCDGDGELLSPPPTCLKQKDQKRLYSAQIPHHAVSYFNVPLLHTGPAKLLRRLKRLCQDGFEVLLAKLREERRRYFWARDMDYLPPSWTPQVYLFSTLLKEVEGKVGKEFLSQEMERIYGEYREELDQRELAFKLVDLIYQYSSKEPMMILGLLPPYYPPVTTSLKEGEVMEKIKDLIRIAKDEFREEISISPFFPGLSDLSYFSLKGDGDLGEWVKPNLPGWGLSYSLPLDAMKDLSFPVINLGVKGKDAHKYTERIALTYSFKVLPRLLHRLVFSFLKSS